MCLSSVYSEENGNKTLVMSKASKLEITPEGIVCRDFLGRKQIVKGVIFSIDMENNVIICKEQSK